MTMLKWTRERISSRTPSIMYMPNNDFLISLTNRTSSLGNTETVGEFSMVSSVLKVSMRESLSTFSIWLICTSSGKVSALLFG